MVDNLRRIKDYSSFDVTRMGLMSLWLAKLLRGLFLNADATMDSTQKKVIYTVTSLREYHVKFFYEFNSKIVERC